MTGGSLRAADWRLYNLLKFELPSGFRLATCLLPMVVLVGCSNSSSVPQSASFAAVAGTPAKLEQRAVKHRVVALAMRAPRGGGARKIGKPYQIKGRWYRPRHEPSYNKVGLASWYGADFHGKRTANGEIFDMNRLTAAHPTLPLPSLVQVTNLHNGRNLVLRVNDRGPYAHDRLIDLSRHSARMLGFERRGTAKVRVTYLRQAPLNGDDGFEVAYLAKQKWYSRRYASASGPSSLNWSTVSKQHVERAQSVGPRRKSDRYLVRAGTFRDRANARRLSQSLGAVGPVSVQQVLRGAVPLYQVNVGPYKGSESAKRALASVRYAGANDAMIISQ